MSVKSNLVKMYPELCPDGAFELPARFSTIIQQIYAIVDSHIECEEILDEYHSGMLKTIEHILSTPIGQLYDTIEDLLEEVQISVMLNSEAEDSEEPSCEILPKLDKEPIERKIELDDDISDEDMLKELSD